MPKLGVFKTEPTQWKNRKSNQSKPKLQKTALGSDEFGWLLHWTVRFGSVSVSGLHLSNRTKPNQTASIINIT